MIPWLGLNGDEILEHNKTVCGRNKEIEIFNDIMENMNGFGVIKIKINNNYFVKNLKLIISTKYLLAFESFNDCIQLISLKKKWSK